MVFDIKSLDHNVFMRAALAEAELAGTDGELPIGAVIVHNGRVIATGRARHNARGSDIAHAEMNALLSAEKYLSANARDGCVIYSTVEPCVMCLGAIVMSNIRHIVFGLEDKWIKPGGMMSIEYVRRHVHSYVGGVLADASVDLFKRFRPEELPIVQEGRWTRPG